MSAHALPSKRPWRQELSALCALAIPVMLEQLGQVLLGTVDTFFSGQINDNAIAAVNVTNMFVNLFATVFTAMGIGIMVMISHALGQKDERQANRILRQAILAGSGVGLAFGVVNFLCRDILLRLAGAEGEIFEMGRIYYLVVCVPCVLMCLTMILSTGLKAAQKARASMWAALTANITNVILDAVFLGTGLGIFGLGLATTLSRLLNLLLLLRVYCAGAGPLKLDRSGWMLEPTLMKQLLSYSGPIMFTQLSARLAVLVHGSLVLRLGSIYYVANSVALTIDEYACIPSAGFEAATASLVSNSLGAGRREDAVDYARLSFLATTCCMTGIGAFLAAFSVPLASLFTDTEAVCGMVRQVLTLMVFFNWTSALSHIFTSAVQGTGNSRYPLYVTLAGSLLMRLAGGYVLAYVFGWKLLGIWVGIILDFLFRGTLLSRRFSRSTRA